MTASPRDAAKHYLGTLSWAPVQLHGLNDAGHCTCADSIKPGHDRQAGKHPRANNWTQDGLLDTPEAIDAAWGTGWMANSNVGIRTGAASGVWVLDVDKDAGGIDSLNRLIKDHGPIGNPVKQRTGGMGFHLAFALPPGEWIPTNSNKALKAYPGLDVRGEGGQVVVWPSVSAKGPYEWLDDPFTTPLQQAPDWLLTLLRPKAVEPAPQVATFTPQTPVPTDAETVRLAAYTATVRDGELSRLDALREKATPDGHGYVGAAWNTTTFEVSCSLVELANSPWSAYDVETARRDLLLRSPRDEGFTNIDAAGCFESAVTKVGKGDRPYPAVRESTQDMATDWAAEMAAQGIRVDPILLKEKGLPLPDRAPKSARVTQPTIESDLPMRTWDDLGNAMRICDHFGAHLRWVAEAEQWAIFRKGAWRLEKANAVQGLVQRMFDELIPATEALAYSDEPEGEEGDEPSLREGFTKWLKSQRMSARIAAAQTEARGRPSLQATMADFDQHPMLLNVRNGVVDLATGELLPHSPDLMLSKQVDVDYDAAATAPLWDNFLARVQPDADMRDFVQRVLGYSVTGSTRDQAYFLWHGDGANGKSVVAGIMSRIMGSYAGTVAAGTLLAAQQETHPTGWAAMAGCRWLPATETAPGKRLEEEKIKEFTGGQPIAARFMAKDFFYFVPVGKIHLITNHLPLLSAQDSMWRRTYLIRWGVTIPAAEQDRMLESKLLAELPGILAWLVRGAQTWNTIGLAMPSCARADLAAYRGDSDPFADFLRECTTPAVGARTPVKPLYEAYSTWAFNQGMKAMTCPSFVSAMQERKVERFRDASARGFLDIVPLAAAVADPWGAREAS